MEIPTLFSRIDDLYYHHENGESLNKGAYLKGVNDNFQKIMYLYNDVRKNADKYYMAIIEHLGDGDQVEGKNKLMKMVGSLPGLIGRNLSDETIINGVIPFYSLDKIIIKKIGDVVTKDKLIGLADTIRNDLGINGKIMSYIRDNGSVDATKYPYLHKRLGSRKGISIPILGDVVKYLHDTNTENGSLNKEYSYIKGIKTISDLLSEAYKNKKTSKWLPVIKLLTKDIIDNVSSEIENYVNGAEEEYEEIIVDNTPVPINQTIRIEESNTGLEEIIEPVFISDEVFEKYTKNITTYRNVSYSKMSEELGMDGEQIRAKMYEMLEKKGVSVPKWFSDYKLFFLKKNTINNEEVSVGGLKGLFGVERLNYYSIMKLISLGLISRKKRGEYLIKINKR